MGRTKAKAPAKPDVLYPLRFEPVLKEEIWGDGALFQKVFRTAGPRRAAETIALKWLDRCASVVANGPWKGRPLDSLIPERAADLLGAEGAARFGGHFPLMVKWLAIRDRLSLQVHPTDEFADRYEAGRTGKMEAWYVLYAEKDARVVHGILPGVTTAEFRAALERGEPEKCLNAIEVRDGDVIFLPPGTVHSAWGGLVVLEVQQNSDVTYRLTDWGRRGLDGRPRRLDVAKALAVADFHTMGVSKMRPQRLAGFSHTRKLLLRCKKFSMDLLELGRSGAAEPAEDDRFRIYAILRGRGAIAHGPKLRMREPFAAGQVFLIPARMGPHKIVPSGTAQIVCVMAR